jgi:4'-phosphopantetheinyl transferase
MNAPPPTGAATFAAAQSGWMPGPSRPHLAPAALHVWRADLTVVAGDVARWLSDEEAERATRIAGDRERRRWMQSRGVLRALLGRYLGKDPMAVELAVGRSGKPELAGTGERRHDLLFNLSHSQHIALYAFTLLSPVGVDVQVARDARTAAGTDRTAVARRAFGAAATRRLQGLEPAAREREFLRLWTRHEAELKRRGTGMSAAAPGARAGATAHAAPWLVELDVGTQAAAAVACERRADELRLWAWRT